MEYQPTYSTEEEFWETFRQFNMLFDFDGWSSHKAAKEHVDELGKTIKEGETYFSRHHGQAYDAKFKLSWNSMDLLLTLVMFNNQTTQVIGAEMLNNRFDFIQKTQNQIIQKKS